MATSSITGGERAAVRPSGRDTDLLGPSDSSDSGSDVQGERGFDALDPAEIGGERADLASDTDASGTGERAAAVHDTDIVEGADIAPDRIFGGPADAESEPDDPDATAIDRLATDESDDGADASADEAEEDRSAGA